MLDVAHRCLTIDDALALASGSVDPAEAARLAAQGDRCEECREILAAALLARTLTIGGDLTADPEPAPPGERYILKEELGRGGQGRVVRAWDAHLSRDVALKELRPGADLRENAGLVERFLREARVASRLDHPHIVAIHDSGLLSDGSPFYTMPLVQGQTLTQRIRDAGGLPGRLGLLRHVEDLAQALAYAHTRGVVHRDLKPQNVMVGAFGETLLLDWGLASVGEVRPVVMGTPAYIAPEQARGELTGPFTDVWGLGAILYEVLSGRAPHQADRPEALRSGEIGPLPPEVPADLGSIALRCLRPRPEDRWPGAAEVAAALRAWDRGDEVPGFAYGPALRARRFLDRNRGPVTAISAGAAVLTGALALVTWSWRSEQLAHQTAQDLALREGQARREADVERASALRAAAVAAWAAGDRVEARARLRSALEVADSPELRLAWQMLADDPVWWARDLPHEVYAIAGRADQTELFAATGAAGLLAVDVQTGRTRVLAETPGDQVSSVALSADGQQILAGTWSGEVLVVARDGGILRRIASPPGLIRVVAWGPGGEVASASESGSIAIDGRPVGQVPGPVVGMRWAPSGRLVIAAASQLWSWRAGQEPELFGPQDESELHGLAIWDEKIVALRSASLVVLGPEGSLIASIPTPIPMFSAAGVDHRHLLAAGNGRLIPYTLDGSELVAGETRALGGRFASMLVLLGDRGVAWADRQRVGAERTDLPAPAKAARRHTLAVYGLDWSPDGASVASAGMEGAVRVWDSATGSQRFAIQAGDGPQRRVRYSADGQVLTTVGSGWGPRFWRARDGRPLGGVGTVMGMTTGALWRGDSLWLSANSGGVHEVRGEGWCSLEGCTSGLARTVVAEGPPIYDLDAGPSGPLWFSDEAGGVSQLDPLTGAVRRVVGHQGAVFGVAVGRDAAWSAGVDGKVLRWGGGEPTLVDHGPARAYWLDLSPDESLLASPRSDHTVALLPTGEGPKRVLVGHRGEVNVARFSPDGTRVATSSDDQSVQLWDVATTLPLWRTVVVRAAEPAWLTHLGWSGPGQALEVDLAGVRQVQESPGGPLCGVAADGGLRRWTMDELTDSMLRWIPEVAPQALRADARISARPDGCLFGDETSVVWWPLGGAPEVLPEGARLVGDGVVWWPGEAPGLGRWPDRRPELPLPEAPAVASWGSEGPWIGAASGAVLRPGGVVLTTLPGPVTALSEGPPGITVAGDAFGDVRLFDPHTGRTLSEQALHGPVSTLRWFGTRLVAATERGDVYSVDLEALSADRCALLEAGPPFRWTQAGVVAAPPECP